MNKKFLSIFLTGAILFSVGGHSIKGQAATQNKSLELINVTIVDSDKYQKQDLKKYSNLEKREFSLKDNLTIIDNPDILGVNVNDLYSKKNLLAKVKTLISNGQSVYIYGENLDIQKLETYLDMELDGIVREEEIKKGNTALIQENEWDIIGIRDKHVDYFEDMACYTYENKKTSPAFDNFVEALFTHKSEHDKKTINLNTYNNYALASDSGHIVQPTYDVTDSLWTADAWGNQILRGRLNCDFELYKDDGVDSDATYDFFSLRNNIELAAYSGNGCRGYSINAAHALVSSSGDQLRGWGPDSTTNTGYFTVGLPFGTSWTFYANQEIDLSTSGSQDTDKVNWTASNKSLIFQYPFSNDLTRITPGSAWASTGTYAATDVTNSAVIKYGGTSYTLTISKNVRYDYQ